MNWFIYSLLGAFFMSAFQVSQKILLKPKSDSQAFTLINSLTGGFLLLLIMVFETIRYTGNYRILIWVFLVALVNGVIDLLFSRARHLEEVSKVAIAIQSGQIWFLLGSFLVFGESLNLVKVFGVFLILSANLLVVWQNQKLRLTKGILLSLLATLLFTLATFSTKVLVQFFSPIFYQATVFLLESILIYLFLGRKVIGRVRSELRFQGRKALVVGPFLALAVFFLTKSLEVGGEASRVFPIFSLALILTTLSGILFLGERASVYKKVLAMILAFIGIYLVRA